MVCGAVSALTSYEECLQVFGVSDKKVVQRESSASHVIFLAIEQRSLGIRWALCAFSIEHLVYNLHACILIDIDIFNTCSFIHHVLIHSSEKIAHGITRVRCGWDKMYSTRIRRYVLRPTSNTPALMTVNELRTTCKTDVPHSSWCRRDIHIFSSHAHRS